ncbi:MAG: SMP-30/gluconolactonase/LRE family protein [Myxococcales bacterium]|nr:SMP-30/gluconolactonase/LRE family protein [Myxococcales bacterium]
MKRLALSLSLLAVPALAGPPATAPAAPAPTAPAKTEPKKPAAAVTFKEGLATPESVLYDAESDTYLVSNINGSPTDKDNNGYIAELAPDGKVVAAKLIAGGEKGVTLNAPKGLAVVGGVLYVADIDTVRLFDRKTGAAKGEVAVPGASFVNDLSAGPDGKLYVTDSGLTPKFESSGTDALYVIELGKKPKLKALLKSKDLPRPNGILATKDTLYVSFFGAAELRAFDLKGKPKGEPTKLPAGGGDGVLLLGEDILVSSWDGKAVFRGKPGGEFTAILSELTAPADLGYDSKRSRVLVPRFQDNLVEAFDVK